MKISKIYEKYQIMPQLSTHMLRVAGVGKIILDRWKGSVDKDLVIKSLLLHDMGNIVKFDLETLIMPIENIEHWRLVQKEWRNKYGTDAYEATKQITKELGRSDVAKIMENEHSGYRSGNPALLLSLGWPEKILSYCDVRVVPSGVASLKERISDLQNRYGRKLEWYDFLYKLESDIKVATDTDLDSITEELVEPLFDELLKTQI